MARAPSGRLRAPWPCEFDFSASVCAWPRARAGVRAYCPFLALSFPSSELPLLAQGSWASRQQGGAPCWLCSCRHLATVCRWSKKYSYAQGTVARIACGQPVRTSRHCCDCASERVLWARGTFCQSRAALRARVVCVQRSWCVQIHVWLRALNSAPALQFQRGAVARMGLVQGQFLGRVRCPE